MKKPTPPPCLFLPRRINSQPGIWSSELFMDSSSLVLLIARILNENSARKTLSSSKCLTRLLMFKQAILKPRLAGRKSQTYQKDPNYPSELRCVQSLATFEKLEDNRHSCNQEINQISHNLQSSFAIVCYLPCLGAVHLC